MKKIIQALISIVIILMLLSVAQAAPEVVSFEEAEQYADFYNRNLSYVPDIVKTLLKDERINVYADEQAIGIITKKGAVEQITAEPLSKPTVNVYTTQETIQEIKKSSNPINTAKIAWKNEEILFKGTTFKSKIKLIFVRALINNFL